MRQEDETRILTPEKEPEDEDENVPWADLIEGVQEALEYAQGKKPAFVTKYVDGKLVSAQWQMVDGTKVDVPE